MIPIVLFYFLLRLRSRLSVLLGNATLLPTKHPKLTSLGGSDEISFVNDPMVSASGRLEDAIDLRNQLVRMVAHDVRTPLQVAGIITDRLNKATGEIDQSQVGKLKHTLTNVNKLVENFLLLEKIDEGELGLDFGVIQSKELVNCGVNGDFIKIKIINSGVKLDRIDAKNIFSEFKQAKSAKAGGFGLGLHICKKIVESHQGSIGVKSDEYGRTVFWFTIPHEA